MGQAIFIREWPERTIGANRGKEKIGHGIYSMADVKLTKRVIAYGTNTNLMASAITTLPASVSAKASLMRTEPPVPVAKV